jgi:hypothetical protein
MSTECTGIICKVWPQCPHPEKCQDKCFDDDLYRERGWVENVTYSINYLHPAFIKIAVEALKKDGN